MMVEVYSQTELQYLMKGCAYKDVFNILYRAHYSDLPDSLVVLHDLKGQALWKELESWAISPSHQKFLTKDSPSSSPCETLASILFKILQNL
jgi:hypothetical protein